MNKSSNQAKLKLQDSQLFYHDLNSQVYNRQRSYGGPLSDRELRLFRRNASIPRAVANAHQVDAEALGEWDDSNQIKSLLSRCGFVIEEVLQRSVMPGRGVWYQVSYNLMGKGKGPVHVWEPSSAVPREAIERWKNSRAGFRYTPDERELMKQCAEVV